MEKNDIFQSINNIDRKDYFEFNPIDYEDFENEIEKILDEKFTIEEKSILGIDIYQYSQFESNKQKFIPILFDLIFDEAKRWCVKDETLFFKNFSFKDKFIHTGDGGFQIFENPLQALVFNINFHSILRLYNSGHFFPKMRRFIGELVLRSCVTIGEIYPYNKNYFGEGIIKNARILSKDKLNRFIIDDKTYTWFLHRINGIESLCILDIETIYSILKNPGLEIYTSAIFGKKETIKDKQTILDSKDNYSKIVKRSYIKDCHVQKIGDIQVKNQDFSIYNIEIQRVASVADEVKTKNQIEYIVTIGNLSATGI